MLLLTYFYVIIGHSVMTKFYNIPLNVILLYYAPFSSVYSLFFFSLQPSLHAVLNTAVFFVFIAIIYYIYAMIEACVAFFSGKPSRPFQTHL